MTFVSVVLGICFAVISIGALSLIALFFACDRAALYEESKRHANKTHH